MLTSEQQDQLGVSIAKFDARESIMDLPRDAAFLGALIEECLRFEAQVLVLAYDDDDARDVAKALDARTHATVRTVESLAPIDYESMSPRAGSVLIGARIRSSVPEPMRSASYDELNDGKVWDILCRHGSADVFCVVNLSLMDCDEIVQRLRAQVSVPVVCLGAATYAI